MEMEEIALPRAMLIPVLLGNVSHHGMKNALNAILNHHGEELSSKCGVFNRVNCPHNANEEQSACRLSPALRNLASPPLLMSQKQAQHICLLTNECLVRKMCLFCYSLLCACVHTHKTTRNSSLVL